MSCGFMSRPAQGRIYCLPRASAGALRYRPTLTPAHRRRKDASPPQTTSACVHFSQQIAPLHKSHNVLAWADTTYHQNAWVGKGQKKKGETSALIFHPARPVVPGPIASLWGIFFLLLARKHVCVLWEKTGVKRGGMESTWG